MCDHGEYLDLNLFNIKNPQCRKEEIVRMRGLKDSRYGERKREEVRDIYIYIY